MVGRATELVLASGSPRRKELLETLGLRPRVLVADVDEAPLPGEAAEDYSRRLASAKAVAVARQLASAEPGETSLVLGADTIVVTDGGQLLGKPAGEDEARRMLEALSGRAHAVLTAFSLWRTGDGEARELETGAARTTVDVRALRREELEGYLATREWEDKAGAYAVQGAFGAFVRGLRGAWANVVGLPVFEVVEALYRAGFFAGRAFPAPPPGARP